MTTQRQKGENAEKRCEELEKQCGKVQRGNEQVKAALVTEQEQVRKVMQKAEEVKAKHDKLRQALTGAHVQLNEGAPSIRTASLIAVACIHIDASAC